jgi:hypothetical protein
MVCTAISPIPVRQNKIMKHIKINKEKIKRSNLFLSAMSKQLPAKTELTHISAIRVMSASLFH